MGQGTWAGAKWWRTLGAISVSCILFLKAYLLQGIATTSRIAASQCVKSKLLTRCCSIAVIWPCLCPGLILCHLSPCSLLSTTLLQSLHSCLSAFGHVHSTQNVSPYLLPSNSFLITNLYSLDLSLNLKPSENPPLTSLEEVMCHPVFTCITSAFLGCSLQS